MSINASSFSHPTIKAKMQAAQVAAIKQAKATRFGHSSVKVKTGKGEFVVNCNKTSMAKPAQYSVSVFYRGNDGHTEKVPKKVLAKAL